jgi:general secretion pathway protein G
MFKKLKHISKFSQINQRGLTLVEIMVVLIIIGLIASMFGKKLFGAGDKMKAQLTQSQLTALKGDIEQFQLRYNSLPTTLDDLVRCTEKTGQACIPITNEDALLDAWGTKLTLQSNGNTYKIMSLGADKQPGGQGVDGDQFVEGP